MKAIEIVSIPVTDQQKSKEFYLKIGFQLFVEAPVGPGLNWVQLGLEGQTTSISLIEKNLDHGPDTYFAKIAPGSMQGLMMQTEDIEKDVKILKSKGVVFERIDNTPFGKFANFSDPDNNGLMLHQGA